MNKVFSYSLYQILLRYPLITDSVHICFFNRDSEVDDTCDQPGDVHVLGDIAVVCNGNHGERWRLHCFIS